MPGSFSAGLIFLAGLGSGVTEAVLVVTPAEVCKIRMQAQFHSMLDPEQMVRRKYHNVLQTAAVVVREEGIGALYKGLLPTTLRQGCNQVQCAYWSKRERESSSSSRTEGTRAQT